MYSLHNSNFLAFPAKILDRQKDGHMPDNGELHKLSLSLQLNNHFITLSQCCNNILFLLGDYCILQLNCSNRSDILVTK